MIPGMIDAVLIFNAAVTGCWLLLRLTRALTSRPLAESIVLVVRWFANRAQAFAIVLDGGLRDYRAERERLDQQPVVCQRAQLREVA